MQLQLGFTRKFANPEITHCIVLIIELVCKM
jgi:hypothetical protein